MNTPPPTDPILRSPVELTDDMFVARLQEHGPLAVGDHPFPEETEHCLLEAISFFSEAQTGDRPECVSKVSALLGLRVQDENQFILEVFNDNPDWIRRFMNTDPLYGGSSDEARQQCMFLYSIRNLVWTAPPYVNQTEMNAKLSSGMTLVAVKEYLDTLARISPSVQEVYETTSWIWRRALRAAIRLLEDLIKGDAVDRAVSFGAMELMDCMQGCTLWGPTQRELLLTALWDILKPLDNTPCPKLDSYEMPPDEEE